MLKSQAIFLFILLVIVVAVSGCIFPTTETTVVSKDLLKINYIDVYPATTVLFDTTLTIRMEIQNYGQTNASVWIDNKGRNILYDYCEDMYTFVDFSSYPKQKPGANELDKEIKLNPGESNTFTWKIRAPKKEQTFGLPAQCDFKFAVKYDALAATYAYVFFVNPYELEQRYYTGKETKFTINNIATFGPAVINFDIPGEAVPAATGGTFALYFDLKNMGSGTINVSSLSVDISPKITSIGTTTDGHMKDCESFKQKSGATTWTAVYDASTSDRAALLRVFEGSSSKFSCVLNTPTDPKYVPIITPFKFVATAAYTFILDQSQTIEAKAKLTSSTS